LVEAFSMQKLERPIRKKVSCKEEEFVFITTGEKVNVTLIRTENGGKANALNMGINASEYPYFVCIDADSMLQKDALNNIMRPILEDSTMIACGGLVRIINDVTLRDGVVVEYKMPKNLLLCMQILEYDRSFLASRLLFDKFNGNLIISGAFGLFKKDMVIAVGGYDFETVGEDMELVIRLHAYCRSNRIPYSIRYAADAVCWSQAPANLKSLKSQRRRWHIGLFQSIWKHKQLILNPAYGIISFVSFLYFLIYELLSPYIELFGLLTILIAYQFNLINVPFMLTFLLIYAFFSGMVTIIAFFSRVHAMDIQLHVGDVLKAISLCLIENIVLRFILVFIRIFAFKGYRKGKMNWGEIKRFHMKK
ncbi:MAG: glycosyltransferase, partial [Anaerovorax sp.]